MLRCIVWQAAAAAGSGEADIVAAAGQAVTSHCAQVRQQIQLRVREFDTPVVEAVLKGISRGRHYRVFEPLATAAAGNIEPGLVVLALTLLVDLANLEHAYGWSMRDVLDA